MDDKELQKLFAPAKKIVLSAEEKSQRRAVLYSFMQLRPAQVVLARSQGFFNRLIRPVPALASILILSLAGGGVAAASEQSLPGDALYPIKIHINEEVRAALAVSTEAKASWEVRRSERRLEEAEKLAVAGKLGPAVRADLERQFEVHAERAEQKKLVKINQRLENTIQKHRQILARLAEEDEKELIEVQPVAVAAMKSDEVSAQQSRRQETAASVAEKKAERVAANLTQALAALIPSAAADEARARLALASKIIAEGKARMSAEAYGEAFVLFQKANRIIKEVRQLEQKQRKPDSAEERRDGRENQLRARLEGFHRP